jgi:hypothetical protein
MLVDAAPVSSAAAGVGANGAGGSGGPLVSGKSSFVLEGISAEVQAHVNKQVRITGTLDANPASVDQSATSSGNTATPGRGSTPGHGSMGSAANAPASGGGRGSMGAATEAAAHEISQRRLVVETLQVVAANCAQPPR